MGGGIFHSTVLIHTVAPVHGRTLELPPPNHPTDNGQLAKVQPQDAERPELSPPRHRAAGARTAHGPEQGLPLPQHSHSHAPKGCSPFLFSSFLFLFLILYFPLFASPRSISQPTRRSLCFPEPPPSPRYLGEVQDAEVKLLLQALQLSLGPCNEHPMTGVLRAQMLGRLVGAAGVRLKCAKCASRAGNVGWGARSAGPLQYSVLTGVVRAQMLGRLVGAVGA